ncbi:MAG: lycopene beta-cyclase CrtY [Sphingomicrobium sp.]
MSKLIIAGGGLSGCLAALALAARRPEVDLLVIEQGPAFGGNHTWSFFDTDIAPGQRWVLDRIGASHWADYDVRFPRRSRTIAVGYNSMQSEALDAAMKQALRPAQYRLGEALAEVGPAHVQLANGERIEADAVIDARGPGRVEGQQLGWQKFLGRTYRFARPHGVARPMIMDATVPQTDGYRFHYLLPFSDRELLIEDTYYSVDPSLDRATLGRNVDQAAAGFGAGKPVMIQEETGVLPVLLRGDFDALWPSGDGVPRLGLRGGFFHPTTSYSLPDAVANAAVIAGHRDLRSASLATLLRKRAEQLWRDRGFFQTLNRMLFQAANPGQEYRVLEHFYRLPATTVARFYGGRLSLSDKLRILSGRPPVPIGRAVAAIFGRAA